MTAIVRTLAPGVSPPQWAGRALTESASQNFPKKQRAAILLADDELTDEQIAAAVGVTRRTLTNWKHDPDFQALIGDYVGQLQASMLRLRVAKKRERMKVLDRLHTAALDVIDARQARYAAKCDGDDAETAAAQAAKRVFGSDVPFEATTGLLVEKETITPQGVSSTEWSVDVGLMREIRAIHEQAARELGQWSDKIDISQHTKVVEVVGVDAEKI